MSGYVYCKTCIYFEVCDDKELKEGCYYGTSEKNSNIEQCNDACYRIQVRGKKNACYAFLGAISGVDTTKVIFQHGTNEDFIIVFAGWFTADSSRHLHESWEGDCPVKLPESNIESLMLGHDTYYMYSTQDLSAMFNVEVWCNSGRLDKPAELYGINFSPFHLPISIYHHFINGIESDDDCPETIKFVY
jgi:hypothetical protein